MKTKNEKSPKADSSVKVDEKPNKLTVATKAEVIEINPQIPVHPLDALIENIKTDRVLLKEQEEKIAEYKQVKNSISNRIKGYKTDLKVFLKYATDKQKQEIESLGFGTEESESNMNEVALITLDIINQKKKLTNGNLYDEYYKVVSEKKEIPEKYTFFNIKIRGLFNRGLLTRTKGSDESSSREDLITLISDNN